MADNVLLSIMETIPGQELTIVGGGMLEDGSLVDYYTIMRPGDTFGEHTFEYMLENYANTAVRYPSMEKIKV